MSATTHRHFDKLVANTKHIGGKYNLHRWQIQSMGWERTRRVPSCQTWQSKAKPAQHSNFQRRQALCHSQLWKTTPGTMPLWKTMHCNWQYWERCTVDERTTVIQFRRRGALRVSGAYRCTFTSSVVQVQPCIWAIYPACTSRAVSGCYRNVAKAQCRVRQWSCHSGRPQAISICHRSCQRTIIVLVWWSWQLLGEDNHDTLL